MRDQLKAAEYWPEAIAANDAMITYLEKSLKQKEAANDPKAAISATSLLMARFQRCLLDYSRGEEIEQIAENAIDLLCVWYPAYMEAHPPGSELAMQRPSYDRINRFFSILILCSPTSSQATKFVKSYAAWDYEAPPAPGKIDHICEAMANYLVSDRKSRRANGINWPEAYGELWRSIAPDTASKERAAHLNIFLEDWYDTMVSEMAAQTGTHKQKNPNYVGYWCLEAGAAAIMVDINEADIQSHRFFPADWADWARAKRA